MRRKEVIGEVKRKSIHLIPGFLAIPVVVWLGNPYATLISLFFLAIYAVHEASLRLNLNWNVPIASHTFKVMARQEELKGRYFTGSVYFWGCTTFIVALMEPTRAAAAVMISSFGDAAAAIGGKAIAGPAIIYNHRKTLAGSLVMLAVSLLSCIVAGIQLNTSIVVSLAATLVESLTWNSVLDELTVPSVAAILLHLLP